MSAIAPWRVAREVSGISRVVSASITVYLDVRKVVDNLGLAGTDMIAVLLVGRSGAILAGDAAGSTSRGPIGWPRALASTLPRTTASVT